MLTLLEVLTGEKFKRQKGNLVFHHRNNINTALKVLQDYGLKLVNISSDDIESGNPKLTLALIWLVALSFNGQKLVNSQAVSGIEKSLLQWARKFTEPHGLKVTDFRSSWSDGRAFLFILHGTVPRFDLQRLLKQPPIFRLQTAFDLGRRHLNIHQLLDPEDVHTTKPDKKSILMYVMSLYHAIENTQLNKDNNNDMDEIQLLDETEDNSSLVDRQEKQTPYKHVGNLSHLDEISLAKSIDDLSKIQATTVKTIVTSKLVATPSTVAITMQTSPEVEQQSNESHSRIIDIFASESRSRPISTATNVSVEIGDYQIAVEEVLTLLLESEEILSREVRICKELTEAKQQFQEHEEFMLKLTDHQRFVGSALEEGARLISESQLLSTGGLSMEEQNEIKHQMHLLNERWETLRVRALEVQAKIHNQLAKVQLQKIEELREFLTKTEDRISRYPELGPGPKELKEQLNEHKALQEDLEEQQKLVDSLSNLIVIVDDDSHNFTDLEDRLTALGERWSHVVKWTANRWDKLQELNYNWQRLTENYRILAKWMDSRERDLKTMESVEVNEIGDVMRRMRELRYCQRDLEVLSKHLADLEEVANSLNVDSSSPLPILENLENLHDRCDALKQILEIQQLRIESMGFQFPSHVTDVIEKPPQWQNFQIRIGLNSDDDQMEVSTDLDDPNDIEETSPQSNKKRKLHKSDKILDLEVKIIEMLNFIDGFEGSLSDFDASDSRRGSLHLDRLDSDLKSRIEEYHQVKEMLDDCQQEREVDLSLEERQLSGISSKYDEFVFKLEDLSLSLKKRMNKDRFYKSLTGLKLVLADSRDWFKQNGHASAITELKSRLSDMESLSPEIEETSLLCQSYKKDDFGEWTGDFNQFMESWVDLKNAISVLIEEKSGLSESEKQLKVLKDFMDQVNKLTVINRTASEMENNLQSLNEASEEYNTRRDILEYLQNHRSELKDFEVFESEWKSLNSNLNANILKQTTVIENLNHFLFEYQSIMGQIKALEKVFSFEMFIIGEKENLERMMKQYESHGVEVKKVEIDIKSVKNFSEIIAGNTNKQYLQQVDDITAKFDRLVVQYKSNRSKLKHALERTDEFMNKVKKIEDWLTELDQNTPAVKVSDIINSNELYQIKLKFQNLKEKCEHETIKFRELNEIGGDILIQVDEDFGHQKQDKRVSYLAKALTKLNARWNDVTSEVYKQTALLERISNQLGEFHTLVVQENGYLDKLEHVLRKSPENAADAEEISEELDDLENIIRNHSDERVEKIQEIGKELVDLEFTPESITNDVRRVVNRWNQLQHQVSGKSIADFACLSNYSPLDTF